MKTTTLNRCGVSLTILLFLAGAVGCHGWHLPPPTRDGLCKPWPGFAPVPCRTAPCCQPAVPCCQPAPVEICEPICVRPESGDNDTRTGLRTIDANEPSTSR